MNRIITKSKVSSDGVLNLSLPLGLEEANREVHVTIDLITKANSMTPEAWQVWVDSMAGSWQGDFQRPPQGNYEERESLS